MNEIIEYRIQVFRDGDWFSYHPLFTLDGAQRVIKEYRDLRPDLKYRIIRIIETVMEE